MPTSPSTRLGLVAPAGSDQILTGDDQIRAIVAVLEARVAVFQTGTAAGRPAASAANAGTTYLATDTGVTYLSTGTKWRVQGGHIGALVHTCRTAAPDGFLICTGQAITTTYPELRAALLADGSPYGTLSGNPLAPPAPGRVAVAAGTGQNLSVRTVGSTAGEETHTMLETELVPHRHTVDVRGGNTTETTTPGGTVPLAGAGLTTFPDPTSPTGGGTPFNIMQPSFVVNLLLQAA